MNKLKTIFRVLIFCLIGILLFLLITPIFIPKTINAKKGEYRNIIQGFYKEPKNTLDVVFIGDSSIHRGISPIEIWEEYGITGYDFASPGQGIWDSYYCMKEVLDYQKPKVIVLHTDAIFKEYTRKKSNKRHLYDNMRNSINKLQGIMDPAQKDSKKDTLTLLFPLLRFHDRWSELSKDDFIYAYKKSGFPSKGFEMEKKVKSYKKGNGYMQKESKKSIIGPKGSEFLNKIKELCDENDIKLMLLETPSPKTWNKTKHEQIEKWSSKNNVQFLDLNLHMEELQIDWNKDTSDEGYHMNIYGAEKNSKYVGKYLKDYYQLPDHRGEKGYEQWVEDAKVYNKQKDEQYK